MMQVLDKHIYYGSRTDKVRLWHVTDAHLGAKTADEDELRRTVNEIARDPDSWWIGGGDYADAICHVGDKRYRPSTLAPWLWGEDDIMGAEADYAVRMLAPIAHKCLGLVEGNHEDAAKQWYGRNLYWEVVTGIAKAAGVYPESLALGVQGFIRIHLRRISKTGSSGSGWLFNVYTHHGFGSGRTDGAHHNTLARVMGTYEFDLALLGHRHVEVDHWHTTLMSTARGWRDRTRLALFVPSFLDALIIPSGKGSPVDSYAERRGYPPLPIGSKPVTIYPDQRSIEYMRSHKFYGDERRVGRVRR